MNARKMERIYVEYGLDVDTWDMFYKMRLHGLISETIWELFYKRCGDLAYGEVNGTIIHSETGKVAYTQDIRGNWNPVK